MSQKTISSTLLHNISEEQLMSFFNRINIQFKEIEKKLTPKSSQNLLTREEVSKLFKCDLSTIHNWTKKGLLKSYGMNGRVYYKMHEIECALIPIGKVESK